MKKIILLSLLLTLLFSISNTFAAEDHWPTWRGPNMIGVSPDGDPPTQWSETENIKWKVELTGDGSNSSPIIWDDKIIFQSAVETDRQPEGQPAAQQQTNTGGGRRGRGGGFGGGGAPANIYEFNLVCLDRNTGQTIWQKTVTEKKPHQGHHDDHGYASFSPITDGSHIWAYYGSFGLYCYDMDGNKVWEKELGQMTTRFGEGTSPALAGDAVIINADHDGDSFIYAFDKNTGEQLWKKARDEGTSHAAPIVIEGHGPLQVVTSATNKIRSYNVENGDILWETGGMTSNVIPTPVVGSDMIYCTSGFRGSALLAIKLGQTGDLTGTEAIAWQVNEGTPYVPSPLLYDDQIYVLSVNSGVVSCYNANTGEPFYTRQGMDQVRDVYASPVGAAGRVYFVGRNGVTYVLKNSETFEVISINELEDSIDCSPAIIGDEIYLKGKKYFYCIKASG